MTRGLFAFVVAVALVLAPGIGVALEQPYRGRPLEPLLAAARAKIWPATITCRAVIASRAGFYRTPNGWTMEHAAGEGQSKEVIWIITIAPERARVTDVQGNVGIYRVTKLDAGGGVHLVEADEGSSIQLISIDMTTSTFVYTTQNAQLLWNRASVLTGRCE